MTVDATSQVAAPAAESAPPSSLWRNRDYMLLWSGQLVSSVGSSVSGPAYPLLALFLTRSPAQAGLLGAFTALPYLIFSLPAGALVDRWDRKRVMILCDTGRALSLATIPIAAVTGHLTIVQLYVTSTVEGTLFVFFNLAETASLPRVVPKAQLPAATAQNQASDGATLLVGPPLGGVLYGLGHAVPFLIDAVSYSASVVSLLFVRTRFQQQRAPARRDLRSEIMEGLVWLWRQPLVRFMAVLTGGLNFVGAASSLMLIVLARQEHATPATIGLMFSIGSIGGLLGSLLAPRLQKRFGFGQIIIGLGWIRVALWPLYAVAPNPLLLGVVFAALALNAPLYNAVQFSYRLALIPDALQGRVNSAFRLVAFGFRPLGVALCGVLLQSAGPQRTVLVFSACVLALAALTTLNTHVRNARPIGSMQ